MSSLCSGGAKDAFALVAYLPNHIASFVDRLRRELAPGCKLRAHITILPPRQLSCTARMASKELHEAISQFRSFRVELKEIEVFSASDVIYLSIGAGWEELNELHATLSRGECGAKELWCYHPHVTLGQDLASDALARAKEIAERRWREYAGPREFTVDKLVFVQGSPERGWADLEEIELLSPVLA